jgi:hypothetical protein
MSNYSQVGSCFKVFIVEIQWFDRNLILMFGLRFIDFLV